MMYPFFYRPLSMKLEDGWPLSTLEQYYQQIASEVSSKGRGSTSRGERVSPHPPRACLGGSWRPFIPSECYPHPLGNVPHVSWITTPRIHHPSIHPVPQVPYSPCPSCKGGRKGTLPLTPLPRQAPGGSATSMRILGSAPPTPQPLWCPQPWTTER